MFNSIQCYVETFLVIKVVPSNGSNLTIGTDKIFYFAYIFGEANILKGVHIIHQPVSC